MSMLSSKCEELRKTAEKLRERTHVKSDKLLHDSALLLYQAADGIESLYKRVEKYRIAELKADYGTSHYYELYGTPERVAQTLIETCIACEVCGDCKKCPLSKAPFCTTNIDYTDYDVVLEWLESEACDD